ncbi:FKBP-type peptidyl-prolyl cis-trans isomerase [Streptomyces sp. NPDC050610]|uniref:FKBP-type peptidyl-prolyl cis-trans isomerase n=1 Tax=Streptomyces sp. NPDC050610 TaxID=3157097 RepID=UPI003427FDDF
MNHTKKTRRFAVALAVPALLLTAAACGSDDGGSADGKAVAKVSGKFGDKPEISAPKDAKPADKLVVKTVSKGDGAKVEKDGFVRFDFAGQTMKDNKNLGSSWDTQAQQPQQDSKAPRRQIVLPMNEQGAQQAAQMQQPAPLPPKVFNALVGQQAGSRVEVEGTAKALLGDGLNKEVLKPEDGLVWVLDIAGAQKVDLKSRAKGDQAKPDDGMPEVKADGQDAATFTVPKGEKAPSELKQQMLIKGKGEEVKAGDGLIGQYTGVTWDGGKKFDSSWDHGGATAFQIGTGSVVPGWDKGLVGKHVGDRVELVVPAKLAYGDNPPKDSGIPKDAALVFVVDIVGKA